MAMDLLRLLAACPLPAICRGEEIDLVRSLRAAGLVVALTPAKDGMPAAASDHAVVLSITPKGQQQLESLAPFLAPSTTSQNGGAPPLHAAMGAS